MNKLEKKELREIKNQIWEKYYIELQILSCSNTRTDE